VLRNVEFVSDPKVALDIARRKPLASGGRMGKATIARIFGDWVPHNPDNAKTFAEKIFKDPEWTQVGMNPYRASYFYDKADGLPVTFADEVVQIGPLVMAKNVKKTTPDNIMFKTNPKEPNSPTFAEGGAVEQTDSMLANGGMMEEGGTVDPVSGNDVPIGSLKEEVRDDIDAKLSEGEFVIPADVVRYIGLERLMKIRDVAKQGLKRMEEVGQMGNAEEAPKANEAFYENDEEFSSSIDEIMAEVDNEDKTVKMAAGGFATGTYKDGMKFNPAVDVRYFKHADGRVIFITYINDRPMTAIPEGFTQTDTPVEQKVGKEADEAAAAEAARVGGSAGGSGGGSDPAVDPNPAWSAMTPAQRSEYYAANPVMAAITTFGQMAFAKTGIGALQNYFVPDFVKEQRETVLQDPSKVPVESRGTSGIAAERESYKNSGVLQGQEAIDAEAAAANVTTDYGALQGQQAIDAEAAAAAEAASIAASGDYSGYETQDSGEAYANYKGGFIKKKNKLAVKTKRGLASK
jgi:hypothetical protein